MKLLVKMIFLVCAVFLQSYSFCSDSPLWLIEEEFIKIGKKDAYEDLQKGWLSSFKSQSTKGGFWRSKNDFWPIYAVQVQAEPQYIYLIPLKDECDFGDFLKKRQDYENSLGDFDRKQRQMLLSMMNFSIWSLHRYLNQCSYPSIADAEKGIDLPFMHYLVVGITPGNEAIFEKHLQDMSKKAQSNSEPFIWKVWKVIAGADIPKYVILQSAGSEQDLEKQKKQLDFLPSNFKDIIRNQREGNAEYNPQLSLKQ